MNRGYLPPRHMQLELRRTDLEGLVRQVLGGGRLEDPGRPPERPAPGEPFSTQSTKHVHCCICSRPFDRRFMSEVQQWVKCCLHVPVVVMRPDEGEFRTYVVQSLHDRDAGATTVAHITRDFARHVNGNQAAFGIRATEGATSLVDQPVHRWNNRDGTSNEQAAVFDVAQADPVHQLLTQAATAWNHAKGRTHTGSNSTKAAERAAGGSKPRSLSSV